MFPAVHSCTTDLIKISSNNNTFLTGKGGLTHKIYNLMNACAKNKIIHNKYNRKAMNRSRANFYRLENAIHFKKFTLIVGS